MKNFNKIFILILIGIVGVSIYTIFVFKEIREITEEILRDHKEWLKSECGEMGEYYLLGEEELGEDVRRIDCISGEGEIRVKYYIRGER